MIENRKNSLAFRVRDYFAYLKKTGGNISERAEGVAIKRHSASNRLTKVRKDLGKAKKDRLTFGEFADYIGTPVDALYDFLRKN